MTTAPEAPWLQAPALSGQHVRLEPLRRDHVPALERAAADGELWKLWFTSVPTPGAMAAYVDAALEMQAQGRAQAFAVIDLASAEVIGSTRYCNAEGAHRRLEIGYTWYARRVQRTALNTECKLLLLQQAFEGWQCIAVELRTHWCNHTSRRAIERLGAKQDGVLRNHQRLADGSLRDTVVYSVVQAEWPAVRRHLAFKLGRG